MEVSSHGLVQGRVNGVVYDVAGFTNLTQDHLDYHGTMDEYFLAKSLLFQPDHAKRGVIFGSDEWAIRLAAEAGITVSSVSYDDAARLELAPTSSAYEWRDQVVELALGARFNVANALLASEMALAAGLTPTQIGEALRTMSPVRGRLQRVEGGQSFSVLVDYAHTPDGLSNILHAANDVKSLESQVILVFGCGGDRDVTKRGPMGEIGVSMSDIAIVTTDNPRSEDPSTIIDQIMLGASQASAPRAKLERVLDRRDAIRLALQLAKGDDVVVIAGKGHEQGQIVGSIVHPFDDVSVAKEELTKLFAGRDS